MITRKELKEFEDKMKQACAFASYANNKTTRKAVDDAVNAYIEAEKNYNEQRKTKVISYSIGIRPTGDYNGRVEVWEDATEQEIETAVFDDCQFYWSHE